MDGKDSNLYVYENYGKLNIRIGSMVIEVMGKSTADKEDDKLKYKNYA